MPKNFVSRDNAEGLIRGVAKKIPQKSVLPTATIETLGLIYQYIGASTGTYKNGYFYKCITDGSTYSWTEVKMPADGEWRGTQAEYDLVKNDIPNDTFIIITDRTGTNPALPSGGSVFKKIGTITSTQVREFLDVPEGVFYYDLIIATGKRSYVQATVISQPNKETGSFQIEGQIMDGSSSYSFCCECDPNIWTSYKIAGYTSASNVAMSIEIYGIKF